MIVNEKIKASEVQLTGIDGEDLGIVSTQEALAMAKKLKVDLVCTSLYQSPPPCKLVGKGQAKEEKASAKKRERAAKVKEIRLTPHIEDHDYDTKKHQCEKILRAGDAVQLVIRLSNSKEGDKAKKLLQELINDLKEAGVKETGIQVSGKQVAVKLNSKG
ncbi:translation initiation factor IF-3 [Paenibacillus sp. 1001270B_150601_E10]|uniref:translation initiation factor IF-3 n=1 Tax=Paenibacillus sp. 1001270B_150601_E10 TaxID=2787079 RepID=UPI00189DD9AF|nr:translation initiation factor IF-3 [Paenibacillus sp. 1001270B_150601_E10]